MKPQLVVNNEKGCARNQLPRIYEIHKDGRKTVPDIISVTRHTGSDVIELRLHNGSKKELTIPTNSIQGVIHILP